MSFASLLSKLQEHPKDTPETRLKQVVRDALKKLPSYRTHSSSRDGIAVLIITDTGNIHEDIWRSWLEEETLGDTRVFVYSDQIDSSRDSTSWLMQHMVTKRPESEQSSSSVVLKALRNILYVLKVALTTSKCDRFLVFGGNQELRGLYDSLFQCVSISIAYHLLPQNRWLYTDSSTVEGQRCHIQQQQCILD